MLSKLQNYSFIYFLPVISRVEVVWVESPAKSMESYASLKQGVRIFFLLSKIWKWSAWPIPQTIPGMTASFLTPGDYLTKVVGESGRFLWVCNICQYSLDHKGNMKKHFARKHAPKQRLPCPHEECESILPNKFDFNNHLYQKHPELVERYRMFLGWA